MLACTKYKTNTIMCCMYVHVLYATINCTYNIQSNIVMLNIAAPNTCLKGF